MAHRRKRRKGCLGRLVAALRRCLGLILPQPRPLRLLGSEVLTVLRYTFSLPPAPAVDDLARREANVVAGTAEGTAVSIAKDATSFTFDFDRDVAVSITLTDIDTSGNRSPASAPLEFTTTDTVPPPQPGILGIAKVEQV